MPAEIVFSGGATVEVLEGNAAVLLQQVNRVREGPAATASGPLPAGWLEITTKDGSVYVNTAQVAYVHDKPPEASPAVSGPLIPDPPV